MSVGYHTRQNFALQILWMLQSLPITVQILQIARQHGRRSLTWACVHINDVAGTRSTLICKKRDPYEAYICIIRTAPWGNRFTIPSKHDFPSESTYPNKQTDRSPHRLKPFPLYSGRLFPGLLKQLHPIRFLCFFWISKNPVESGKQAQGSTLLYDSLWRTCRTCFYCV